ncbi:MAG TPA: ATP synthase F1 subunit delta [Longimicrobiales bacterium]|nr:ATP synthase F1 subunit delta [Longimicrobiales bacterium]
MRDETIARNYAETLLELGREHGEAEAYAAAFAELDGALLGDERIRRFLETPQIEQGAKQSALRNALDGKVPESFLRFLLVVLAHRRQRLLHEIREEYDALLDDQAGRMHAQVTLARPADEAMVREIADRLTAMLGKTVVPHVTVNPAIVGGIIVKYGDRVLDGSLRRQLLSLKREMMHAPLPHGAAAGA